MVYQLDDYRNSRPAITDERIPPQSIEAEEAILGGLLLDPDSLSRIADQLPPEAFYMGTHQEIYKACLSLAALDKPCDLTHVIIWLNEHGTLDKCGGQAGVGRLADCALSALNIDHYAALVIEKWKRRKLIAIAQELNQLARQPDQPITDIVDKAESGLMGLAADAQQKGLQILWDVLTTETARIEKIANGELEAAGLTTGFYDLDAMTQGLKPGQLVIVAGRPSMGKSAFAAVMGLQICQLHNLPVALFSLEMESSEVARRLLACSAEVDSNRLGAGQIQEAEWEPIGTALNRLSGVPFYIDDSQDVSINQVRSQARRLRGEWGKLGMIVIDYLHLMLDSDDDQKQLGQITRQAKKLARELQCPVLLLSQLNRAIEGNGDKRPQLSHLRQSGAIEQDADIVMMLYRDEYYHPETNDRGIAEVLIRKNRGGPTGTVKLLFEPQFTRFRNLARRAD